MSEGTTPRATFHRSVVTLMGSGAFGHLVVAAAAPLLTRLYSPEDFGVLGIYASVLALLLVVSSGRYEMALPLPRRDANAARVLLLAFVLLAASGALTASVLGVLAASGRAPALPRIFVLLVPVGLMLGGSYQIANYWAVRVGRFQTLARTKVYQAVGGSGTQLGLGLLGLGPVGLILGQIVRQGAGSVLLLRDAGQGLAFLRNGVSWGRLRAVARRYRRFPLFTAPESLFNAASVELPILILAAFFRESQLGLFYLAIRMRQLPVSLLTQSVGHVLFGIAPSALRSGGLPRVVRDVAGSTFRLFVVPLALLAASAPQFFVVVFGSEWLEAGTLIQWMTPWLLAQLIASPLTFLIPVLDLQRAGLISQILFAAVRLSALVGGAWSLGFQGAVAAYALAGALCYGGYAVWITGKAGVERSAWLRAHSHILLAALVTGGLMALWAARGPSGPERLAFVVAVVGGSLGWVAFQIPTVVRTLRAMEEDHEHV